jgi:hypothetical protein
MISWVVASQMKHICVQLDSACSKSDRNAKPRYNNSRNKDAIKAIVGFEAKQLLY